MSTKTKDELEKQINDNLTLTKGDVALNVAAGTTKAAIAGGLIASAATFHNIGDKITTAASNAVEGNRINPNVFREELGKVGLDKLAEGAQQGGAKFAKAFAGQVKNTLMENKRLGLAIVGGTVVLGAISTAIGLHRTRTHKDEKVGEAYRQHKEQFGTEPFSHAAAEEQRIAAAASKDNQR